MGSVTEAPLPEARLGLEETDDVAVVGYSFKLPQGIEDDYSFWEVLQNRRNLSTEWPASRVNIDSFLDGKSHTFNGRRGHFIDDDVAAFDAPFFSVTSKEAKAMDPMQRWTLEASYRAFEKAGIPVESLKGSRTAVFSASMLEDYMRMSAMDPDNAERTAVTGCTVACVIPNRVSWYFDLQGPSIHCNTACSSSLSAVDMACKSIKAGDATCALVTGSNLLLDPAIFQLLSDQNFLSPDGVCYSFDHRANGYARGEGIIALVLKPVSAAVRDGDMIRAVIRSIGSNQDGRSPVLTQPSPQAQEDLIRHVYKRENLSLDETRYVEAHGTGTPVGDPIEMKAIGRVFRKARSAEEPLYVGSVKANIGHLEGASALASLIKSILILEKGIIPPNALFEKINPDIDVDFYHTEVPSESVVWPTSGLRRVSVNSFGFGGSNTHVVLDDAYHYLTDRHLSGNHCTSPVPGNAAGNPIPNGNGTLRTDAVVNGSNGASRPLNGSSVGHPLNGASGNGSTTKEQPVNGLGAARGNGNLPRMMVWTAADENAVKRTVGVYQKFYQERVSGNPEKLDRLAWTLASRRSQMLWRTFAIVADGPELQGDKILSPAKPVRREAEAGLAFVFTGQGAQYADMGHDLIEYPVFAATLRRIDDVYADLGCTWSIFDELGSIENINKAEYAQPLSTAVQIALVELMKSFEVVPKAVTGHSSGEIAAAYATGALSLVSACKVSYYRGQLAGKLRSANASCPGAMISINLAENQVPVFLENIKATDVCVACINSPLNCTLSGLEVSIDAVKAEADKIGIFAQKLKTGVAYHSSSMLAIADEYLSLMGSLESAEPQIAKTKSAIPMVSSVTGRSIRPAELTKGQYWVENMVSPVRFADAVQVLTQESAKLKVGLGNITDLVEVGPHPALRRPISDTINQERNRKKQIRYSSVLHRSQPPIQTTLELMGRLFCHGHPVSVSAVNQQTTNRQPAFLVDCPQYPFDHSHKYWAESRISRDYRLRGTVKGETLGVRVSDWNELEPRWRNFLSIDSTPFAGHHMISDTVVYPAAGMLIMAIEAVQQMVPADRVVAGYFVKEATFISPIIIEETWEDRTETSLTLRPVGQQSGVNPTHFETTIFSYRKGQWTECSRATIKVDYAESVAAEDVGDERRLVEEDIKRQHELVTGGCDKPMDSNVHYNNASEQGLQYGDWFSILQDICWDSKQSAVGRVDVSKKRYQTSSLVHPAILDTAFHILRVSAGSQPAANVPVRVENAWFASSGWQHPETNYVRWLATSNSPLNGQVGRGEQGRLHALSDNGKVLCTIQKAVTAAVTTGAQEKETRLLYGVEWKPQLSLLEPKQLAAACRADSYTRDETVVLANHAKMCSALDLAAARTLKSVDHSKVPEGLVKHVEWMRHHVSHNMTPAARQEAEILSDSEVEARLSEVDTVLPAWKLYTECARKLPEMLSGELDPLQVVFGSDLANIFYEDLFLNLCSDGRLARLLDLASHENPALRFLEVGAGTGGMTGHIIKALQEREARTGSPSFSEYTYTDISPAFFERAKSRWPDLQDRMTFKTLDLDRSVDSQGFEAGSYDYIVAASVLHATPHLEENIRSISKALKPGGRLILLEVINPDDIATNFMAGLVPGWWVAREEWRPHSAAIPEHLWDKCLRENGFSGNNVVIRDYENDKCHIMSIIVSTAVGQPLDAQETPSKSGKVVFVIDDSERDQQQDLVNSVRSKVGIKDQHADVCPFTLDCLEVTLAGLTEHDTVICLAEADKPVLANLTEEKFKSLQYLISHARKLLWVTSASTGDSQYPDYSIMQGFFRTIRAEQSDSHIVTLAIEGAADMATRASYVQKVFQSSFGPQPSGELEYHVIEGLLTTGRAVEDVTGNRTVRSLLSRQLQLKSWAEGPALQLSVGSPGNLDTLRFVEDVSHETELGALEVEIDAKAWGLVPRDVQAVMGRLDGDDSMLGGDCAGVVTRVGRDCTGSSSIKPGDRVWMMTPGCTRQFPRADIKNVVNIPGSMMFEDVTSICVPTMAAYQALVEIGRLEEGDRVLVHSAAGIMGQVAVQIAKLQRAEVFATASTPEERQFLVDRLGIPKDHIFSSTSGLFAQGVMRVTRGEGVDVVYNSLPGADALTASCQCTARNGHLIQINPTDIGASASLPAAILTRNISFSAVDVLKLSPKVVWRLLKKTTRLMEEGKVQQLQPVRVFDASEIEEAFKDLQGGSSLGRVVVAPKPEDVVPQFTQERRSWKFDENASYLVAGGSGGLGRAILNWMADRGAKHLIVPSRSGASSKAAADMITQLRARGVTVIAPRCDVSDPASLGSVLEVCSKTLPPIKGCINGAMVLQDAIMANMTFAQWELTMKSKVQTSWNLHRLLPKDLDFFILLASLAGVAGQMASANYAGGCTFQDALARHRIAQGQRAMSLDIGWMRNVGIIAENSGYQRQRQSLNDMNPIDDTELLAVLALACDPEDPLPTPAAPRAPGQVLLGLRTPVENMLQGVESPAVLDRPLFAGFSFIPGGGSSSSQAAAGAGAGGSGPSSAATADQGAGMLFRQASDPGERVAVVLRALSAKLGRAMSIAPEDVEPGKALSAYGVDSLMAVELRNWIGREFGAAVAVFDIMGGVPIASVADLVTARSGGAGGG